MADLQDPQSLDNRKLSAIARNPSHPMHTHAKSELDRRRMKQEKTLTPAEIRKRDKIAKAIKKDDPDMPMDKKMAIATATAKRVAEGKVDEVSSKTLSSYMRKSATDAGKPRQSARTQDKRIGGQKMADDKLRKMDGKGSAAKVAATNEVLDTPKAMQSYKDKAKYSKDKATNSAVANILRKGDHTDDLKTRAKRVKGLGMADRNATNKTAKALRKEESVNELSKDTMQSYWDKTKSDDAFSGSRKANNRLKGAINVTTKLDRIKKMTKK